MKDSKTEGYSALLDGESDPHEHKLLLDDLAADAETRARLGRYSMIGEGLRGEPVRVDALSIADAVRERVHREPAILAPASPDLKARRSWRQPLAGLAIAASVAMVAVGLIPKLLSDSPEGGSQPVQVVGVPAVQPVLVSSPGTHWSDSRPEQEDRINRYLADHNEFATQSGMPGIVPYATFVSYDGKE
jgi:sigma-E factor negative regulatory protein RseA